MLETTDLTQSSRKTGKRSRLKGRLASNSKVRCGKILKSFSTKPQSAERSQREKNDGGRMASGNNELKKKGAKFACVGRMSDVSPNQERIKKSEEARVKKEEGKRSQQQKRREMGGKKGTWPKKSGLGKRKGNGYLSMDCNKNIYLPQKKQQNFRMMVRRRGEQDVGKSGREKRRLNLLTGGKIETGVGGYRRSQKAHNEWNNVPGGKCCVSTAYKEGQGRFRCQRLVC